MEEKIKITEIIIKSKPRQQMMESPMSELILKEKEFFVETEGENDTFVARFKIGDGKTKYSDLPYQSSIYKLFPEFYLYNNNYSYGVKIKFKNE
jgi:hypothetical protein